MRCAGYHQEEVGGLVGGIEASEVIGYSMAFCGYLCSPSCVRSGDQKS